MRYLSHVISAHLLPAFLRRGGRLSPVPFTAYSVNRLNPVSWNTWCFVDSLQVAKSFIGDLSQTVFKKNPMTPERKKQQPPTKRPNDLESHCQRYLQRIPKTLENIPKVSPISNISWKLKTLPHMPSDAPHIPSRRLKKNPKTPLKAMFLSSKVTFWRGLEGHLWLCSGSCCCCKGSLPLSESLQISYPQSSWKKVYWANHRVGCMRKIEPRMNI